MLRATSRSAAPCETAKNAQSDELVKSAKRKLQDNQFDDAEALFTKAIKMDPENMKALEGRAVAFERQGDYKGALGDARAIIKQFPKCSQGYLRCGKLLRLMNRQEDAKVIYQVGLELVPKEDQLYQEIEKQLQSIVGNASITAKTSHLSVDFMTLLFPRLSDPLPLAYTSKASLAAFREYMMTCTFLKIDSKLKASSLKILLPSKTHIIIDGPTALKNLLVAVKAGIDICIQTCEFIDCNRVEPFDLSRAISLGLLETIKYVTVSGDTSEVLLTALLAKASNMTSLTLLNVGCKPQNVSFELPNVTSFRSVQSCVGQQLVQIFRSRQMNCIYWDQPVDQKWDCSEYANYIIDNQSALDRIIGDTRVFAKRTDICFNTPLSTIVIDRLCCERALIMNARVEVAEMSSIKQLYLKQCMVNKVDWSKFPSLTSLWLEGCVDGLEESCLQSVASLPNLRELLIAGSILGSPFLPTALQSSIPKLRVFGVVECGTTSGPSLDGCDHVVQVKTRAEFEFIRKKRWDIQGLYI